MINYSMSHPYGRGGGEISMFGPEQAIQVI